MTAIRTRLEPVRDSVTRRLTLVPDGGGGEPIDCYATVGTYPDGTPGELFLKVSRQGSTLSGFADALAIAISIGLQHGVPLAVYTDKLRHGRFEPEGRIENPWNSEKRRASSLVDLVMSWLADRFVVPTQPID